MDHTKQVTMTPEEKQEFSTMKGDIKDIKVQMGTIGSQMTDCLHALVGNAIGKDGGLVGRIERIETNFKAFKDEVEEELRTIKEEAAKSRFHLNVIWACTGAVGMGILGYVLQLIFKH